MELYAGQIKKTHIIKATSTLTSQSLNKLLFVNIIEDELNKTKMTAARGLFEEETLVTFQVFK